MQRRSINAPDAPVSAGGYDQAVEVTGPSRRLYISGQIPATPDGTVPDGFEAQCRLVWANLEAQLRAADMSLGHIVRLTVYLADRAHALDARKIRVEVLGQNRPAISTLITGIFDERWLLEIDAIAESPV